MELQDQTMDEFKNESCTFCGLFCYGHYVYFTKKKSPRSSVYISTAIPRCKECIILQKELQRCTEKGKKIREILHEDEVKGKEERLDKKEKKEDEENLKAKAKGQDQDTLVEEQDLVVKKQKSEGGEDN